MGRRLRQARQDRMQAQETWARRQDSPPAAPADRALQAWRGAAHAAGPPWTERPPTSRPPLERRSRILPPVRLSAATPQPSAQVEHRWHAAVEAIAAWAPRQQWPARPATRQQGRKPRPALAALVDCGWQGVGQAVEPGILSPLWRPWGQESLRPRVYGARQAAQTRCPRRQARLGPALEAVRAAFDPPALTQRRAPQVLGAWPAWATERVHGLQRAAAAVEGRTGYVSQRQHQHRGLPKPREKVWTVRHNCAGRAADGTTPAARFCGWSFPDLFATALSHLAALPRPRQRDRASVRSG